MKIWAAITILFFIVTLMGFSTSLPEVPNVKTVKKTAEAVKAGLKLYDNRCANCHQNTEIDMTKNTYSKMMPMLAQMVDREKLTKKEIENVAAYVYAVSKK